MAYHPMGGEVHTADAQIAGLAAPSHGVVTRRELLTAGLTARQIEVRLGRGSLIAIHRGVYRVGHAAPSVRATYLAAVRAAGADASLCARPAGWLLGILRGQAPSAEVVTSGQRRVSGVHIRRTRCPIDAWVIDAIPVTSPAWTLVDLAAMLGAEALSRAAHEAWIHHRVGAPHVERMLARRPSSPGAAALRRIVRGDHHLLLSRLEALFIALLRRHGLPLPVTNRPAGGRYVDCRWPAHRLTVELDSYSFHATRHAWERDRRREREAYARGDDFRRYTWDDVTAHEAALVRELVPLLAAGV